MIDDVIKDSPVLTTDGEYVGGEGSTILGGVGVGGQYLV